jgi:hypothetical protein
VPSDPEVFISYRRADSAGHAGRLAEALGRRFGTDRVFQDLETIRAGQDYVDAITRALARAEVVLVLIGPDWTGREAGAGGGRLFEPADVVRHEVGQALALGKRVIPVLVGGASVPSEADVPEEMRPLLSRNAFALTNAGWSADFERLCAELAGTPAGGRPEAAHAVWWVVAGVAMLAGVYALDSLAASGLRPRGALLLLTVAGFLFGLGIGQARRVRRRPAEIAAWTGLALCAISAAVLL